MQINAKPDEMTSGGTSVLSKDVIHWKLLIATYADPADAAICLTQTFGKFAELFGLPTLPASDSKSGWPSRLIQTPEGFEITVGSNRTNSFSLQQMQAAGSISTHHGALPLIALWYVGQKLSATDLGFVWVTTDDTDEVDRLEHFSDLRPWFELVEQSYDHWVVVARQKDLLPRLLNSTEDALAEEGFFF